MLGLIVMAAPARAHAWGAIWPEWDYPRWLDDRTLECYSGMVERAVTFGWPIPAAAQQFPLAFAGAEGWVTNAGSIHTNAAGWIAYCNNVNGRMTCVAPAGQPENWLETPSNRLGDCYYWGFTLDDSVAFATNWPMAVDGLQTNGAWARLWSGKVWPGTTNVIVLDKGHAGYRLVVTSTVVPGGGYGFVYLDDVTFNHLFFRFPTNTLANSKAWLLPVLTNFVERRAAPSGNFASYLDAHTNLPRWSETGILAHLSLPTNYFAYTPLYRAWSGIGPFTNDMAVIGHPHGWTNAQTEAAGAANLPAGRYVWYTTDYDWEGVHRILTNLVWTEGAAQWSASPTWPDYVDPVTFATGLSYSLASANAKGFWHEYPEFGIKGPDGIRQWAVAKGHINAFWDGGTNWAFYDGGNLRMEEYGYDFTCERTPWCFSGGGTKFDIYEGDANLYTNITLTYASSTGDVEAEVEVWTNSVTNLVYWYGESRFSGYYTWSTVVSNYGSSVTNTITNIQTTVTLVSSNEVVQTNVVVYNFRAGASDVFGWLETVPGAVATNDAAGTERLEYYYVPEYYVRCSAPYPVVWFNTPNDSESNHITEAAWPWGDEVDNSNIPGTGTSLSESNYTPEFATFGHPDVAQTHEQLVGTARNTAKDYWTRAFGYNDVDADGYASGAIGDYEQPLNLQPPWMTTMPSTATPTRAKGWIVTNQAVVVKWDQDARGWRYK